MHPRVWHAWAVQFSAALSAAVPQAAKDEDVATSASRMKFPGNVSDATTQASFSETASLLNDSPTVRLPSLNDTFSPPGNFSASLYDPQLGYDLPRVSPARAQCLGTRHGTDLNRLSCLDAWQNMDWMTGRVSWGPRGPSHNFENTLPRRWSSGE